MKLIIFGIAVCSVIVWACGPSSTESNARQVDIPTDLKITLERTACEGTCPVYKLTVLADGSTTFNGIRDTETIGIVHIKTEKKKILELIEVFNEADYFSLPDSFERDSPPCGKWVTDLPSAITFIRKNETEKEIDHYYGCRGDGKASKESLKLLTALEKKIDNIVETKRWIGEQK